MASFVSINPTTGALLSTHHAHTTAQVEEALSAVSFAQQSWAQRPPEERAPVLEALAERLEARKEELARLMTGEMGKVIREARAEVEKCASVCRYYAEHGPRMLASEPVATEAQESYVCYHPMGNVLAVMPWNFPFWQVFRCAVPALMGGNAIVLKHASNVVSCALALEALFCEAGAEDLLRVVLTSHLSLDELIGDRRIHAVAFTGSTQAGRIIAASAGRHLKKCLLELGGSDPFVVLHDADPVEAARLATTARLRNAGQSCIAAKRFIIAASRHDAFVDALIESFRAIRMGDPNQDETDLGPLARRDLREALHDQVVRTLDAGAVLRLGGEKAPGTGAFYPPTILDQVTADMPAFREELFGPVAPVISAPDDEAAIALANETCYGLGATLVTADIARGQDLAARRLEAGSVFVNDFVRSDQRLPFGGIKESGYGRELGLSGLREFVYAKSVWVK